MFYPKEFEAALPDLFPPCLSEIEIFIEKNARSLAVFTLVVANAQKNEPS